MGNKIVVTLVLIEAVLRSYLLIQNLTIDRRLTQVPTRNFTKVVDLNLFWILVLYSREVDDVTNLFKLLKFVELLRALCPLLDLFLICIESLDILMQITPLAAIMVLQSLPYNFPFLNLFLHQRVFETLRANTPQLILRLASLTHIFKPEFNLEIIIKVLVLSN